MLQLSLAALHTLDFLVCLVNVNKMIICLFMEADACIYTAADNAIGTYEELLC